MGTTNAEWDTTTPDTIHVVRARSPHNIRVSMICAPALLLVPRVPQIVVLTSSAVVCLLVLVQLLHLNPTATVHAITAAASAAAAGTHSPTAAMARHARSWGACCCCPE